MTVVAADLEAFIATNRGDVERALASIQLDLLGKLTLDVVIAGAPTANMTVAELLLDQLEKLERLDEFLAAIGEVGGQLGVTPPAIAFGRADATKFGVFAQRADRFRCRVLVDHQIVGSGCLVGPSLVLTAWHVIASTAPGLPHATAETIEVRLSDGSVFPARVPPKFQSPAGADELAGRAPKSDADVVGRKDIALLTTDKPVAAHLDFAPIPANPPAPYQFSNVFLFDFPNGVNAGMAFGKTSRMPGVSVRWRHDIRTDVGSSGGAAFGDRMDLLGVHQGKWGSTRGRLIPAWVFVDDIRAFVEEDRAPSSLWTLDRTPGGQLIIGRDAFFLGVKAAGRDASPIRGVRIKRRDVAVGATGLSFSFELLVQLLARKGAAHRPVRFTFREQEPDLEEDIRRRLQKAGFSIGPPVAAAGVQVGQAALEAVMKDRARVLAAAIDAEAHRREEIVWLFFDAPASGQSDESRLFFEAFVAAALLRHRLRVVIVGFETAQLAGEEFAAPADAADDGPPGFLVEYLGGFTLTDVQNLLHRASTDLLGEPDPAINTIASTAVQDLTPFNTVFRDIDIPIVLENLRPTIRLWLTQAGVA